MTKKNRNVSTILKYKDYRRIFEISYLKKSNKWRISYKFKYLADKKLNIVGTYLVITMGRLLHITKLTFTTEACVKKWYLY